MINGEARRTEVNSGIRYYSVLYSIYLIVLDTVGVDIVSVIGVIRTLIVTMLATMLATMIATLTTCRSLPLGRPRVIVLIKLFPSSGLCALFPPLWEWLIPTTCLVVP